MRSPCRAPAPLAGLLLLVLVACGRPPDAVRIEPALPDTVPAALVGGAPMPAASLAVPQLAVAATGDDPALLAAVRGTLGDDLDHYSVVARRLSDGRGVAVNADRVYYAASLFKLALLYEAERRRSAGTLDFDAALELRDEDIEQDLGTVGALGLGADGTLTLGAAVGAMVTLSDNASAVALLRLLGPATVDRTLAGLGLRDTSVNTRELPTTAADMALLMEAVVRGTGVDPAWREDMVGLLLRQETRHGIPRLLPPGVRAGNKTGTWPGATHDVAFVDAPGGLYVIAVLSDRGWDWDPIARVSRAVYDALAR
jgi:beta-lactamase class A